MAQVWNSFFTWPAAVGSVAIALTALGAAACGGKGERQTANGNPVVDSELQVDPCNPTATIELSQFGCTPGQTFPAGNGAQRTARCLDWETGAPTGSFVYPDSIVSGIAGLDDWTNPSANSLDPTTIPDNFTYCGNSVRDCSARKNCYAFHFTAHNEIVWGPQFGVQYTANSDSPLPAVDVTKWEGKEWDGMAFWIRKGNDLPELEPVGTSLFVSLRDNNTMSFEQGGKLCNDKSNYDKEKCDPYGSAVGFDDTWRYVVIPFDSMKQRGYGVREDELNRTQIKKITFSMDVGDAANGNWNVWVDDIMLYRRLNSPNDGG